MIALPYRPVHRVHMRDYKHQTLDERARLVHQWSEFLAGCVVVAICAAIFVVLAVRAGAA